MSAIRIPRLLTCLGLLFGFIPALSQAADKVASQVTVQWLGHASFKLTPVAGKVILIDPYITKNPKLSAEQKDLTKLGKIDLILVTHAHGDHVGDGPTLAKMHNAPLYGPSGLNNTLVALGELPTELAPRFNKGGVITPLGEGVKITMTRQNTARNTRGPTPKPIKPKYTSAGNQPVLSLSLKMASRSITWATPAFSAT